MAVSPFVIAFVPVQASGTPVCHEDTALTWDTPSELARLPLAPSDRRYVEFLLARAAASEAIVVPADFAYNGVNRGLVSRLRPIFILHRNETWVLPLRWP